MKLETLLKPCLRCNHPRQEHSGVAMQGACPVPVRDAVGVVPYALRHWKPAPWGLPADGPWMIYAECESSTHNTEEAGRKGCSCPRAQSLQPPRKEKAEKIPPPWVVRTRLPMVSGICNDPDLLPVVDRAYASAAGYAEMKGVCEICPVRLTECLPAVEKTERPPGSFGGVWAGMSPGERVKHSRAMSST